MRPSGEPSFPYAAGILFRLGLGRFFDGIVLHQILQWHHMLTAPGSLPTVCTTCRSTRSGTACSMPPPTSTLSQALPSCGGAHGPHLWWSTRLLIGTMLIGFGAFNVVQGLVDHHSLGLHHV